MKNLIWIVNGVLAICIGVLFFLHFRDCRSCAKPATNSLKGAESKGSATAIAYVDLDTLETYYTYYKEKKGELEKRQKGVEATLTSRGEQLQREVYDLQQKASTMTQTEGEAAQQRLLQKKNEIEQYQEQMSRSLQEELLKFNKEVSAKMDTVIADYNKDKKYSYVLSYQKGGAILFKDKTNDITKEIVDAMNAKTEVKK